MKSVGRYITNICVLVVFIYTVCITGGHINGRVVIGGLFPLSEKVPEGVIGRGVKPAVNLAREMINKNKDVLPDHILDIVDSDTECDMAVATKFFFDMVDSDNTLVMVFGDACSTVSGPIAEISKEWNVSLVSKIQCNNYVELSVCLVEVSFDSC
ncbi:Gamma-aminobutyric acid type B receptor subunit 1 [Mactra antiquata]